MIGTYHEAVGHGNVLVRGPQSDGTVLMVQVSSMLGDKDMSMEKVYDVLYSGARNGYHRLTDFWEVPLWIAQVSSVLPQADLMVVRDVPSAIERLRYSSYQIALVSLMDVHTDAVRDIVAQSGVTFLIGGYHEGDIHGARKMSSIREMCDILGVRYHRSWDYSMFRGCQVIPRLTLSRGCRYHCSFCVVPKQVVEIKEEEVWRQVDSFAPLDFSLVYLDDKTFGQASNYRMLPEVSERIRMVNPGFMGFIVQTTAPKALSLEDDLFGEGLIRYVEIGVESFNDPILRRLRKPANEAMMEDAFHRLGSLGVRAIPNIMGGLCGWDDGEWWEEDESTYGRTLEFLERHAKCVSHVNFYGYAPYNGLGVSESLEQEDMNENTIRRSYHRNPGVHDWFKDRVVEYSLRRLRERDDAGVVELADTRDSRSRAERREGSTPSSGTKAE